MDAALVAAAVPSEVIEAYICETFPIPMQALIRSQPASSWVQPERLVQFAADYYQRGTAVSAASTTRTPPLRVSTSPGHSARLPGAGLRSTSGSPVVAGANPRASAQESAQRSVRIVDMTPFPDFPRQGGASLLKNIEEVYVLTDIPECWPVPRVNTAYLLDLRSAQTIYDKDGGKALSMDAIVKRHDQDSWGGGSGGSRDPAKQTSVALLGGIKCMQSTRMCNGLYVCSEFDPAHLEGYQRFEPDWEKTNDIFAASQKLNENEGTSPLAICATFYNLLIRTDCPDPACKANIALHTLEKAS
ncbi:hypothetical protein AURDEDRAFT_160297 [Auricularia subglabra TFB-10046 SS5]|nr:hypothetical protein AURDEDRAFT_160297 [Auricularia subglabra TFB-10046 SS5]